jgi:hypothetical protein
MLILMAMSIANLVATYLKEQTILEVNNELHTHAVYLNLKNVSISRTRQHRYTKVLGLRRMKIVNKVKESGQRLVVSFFGTTIHAMVNSKHVRK